MQDDNLFMISRGETHETTTSKVLNAEHDNTHYPLSIHILLRTESDGVLPDVWSRSLAHASRRWHQPGRNVMKVGNDSLTEESQCFML